MICRGSIFPALALIVCFGGKGALLESGRTHAVSVELRLILPCNFPRNFGYLDRLRPPHFEEFGRSERFAVESLRRRLSVPPGAVWEIFVAVRSAKGRTEIASEQA
jgi:hypothetical protein